MTRLEKLFKADEKNFKTPEEVTKRFIDECKKEGHSLEEIKRIASSPDVGFILAISKGIDKDKINFSIIKKPSIIKGFGDELTVNPKSPDYGYLIYGIKDSRIMVITKDRNYNLQIKQINSGKLNNRILRWALDTTDEASKEMFKTLVNILKDSEAKGGLIKLNPKGIRDVKTKELSFSIPIRN